MAVRLDVRSQLPDLIAKIDRLRRDQLPFAIAQAVTRTAQLVQRGEYYEMPHAFDRPTPYTQNSLYLSPATKAIPVAKVWIKDDAGKGTPATKYLLPEITGGGRGMKRFELRLQYMNLLPPGMQVVPGDGVKLDAYGNVPASLIEQILSSVGAAEIFSGYKANRTRQSAQRKGAKAAQYFVGQPGGAPLGVYQRFTFSAGSAVKPILIFVRPATYKPRYRFQEIADQIVREEFPGQFSQSYKLAVQTAGFKP